MLNQTRKPGIPAEEITRVKGLGFLWDKTTPDCFNGRVITRNGKMTAKELAAVAEAAEKFGNGQVALTVRLTAEIQKVPFENIEPLREFLKERGLETGGTGAKVRPVVSCKGTTCQYGLIDTFALSEAIHKRFYEGWHDVKLPHKFKIAVGGCPNNCVKPDLNDLGIVGQRVPVIDLEECRGCKVCQIEKNCPIHVPKVVDGKVLIDDAQCNHCGRCINKCPFKAFEEYVPGYKVYIGGRWGKKVARGKFLGKLLTSPEEVLDVIEKAQGICEGKLSDGLLSVFLLAVFCNILIYLSVESYRENPHELGKYLGLFLGVVVFVQAGFEHCVANMFYFTVAGAWSGKTVLYLVVMTLGNAAGGVLFPLGKKLRARAEG